MGKRPILASESPVVRPTSPPPSRSPSKAAWRQELREALRTPGELVERLGLPTELAAKAGDFPVLVPASYLARMRPGDPADPLLRQVLPVAAEHLAVEGFSTDPVGDAPASLEPGLLQKYQGRVLMVTTGACAVHCRYCFRRHYPYATAAATPSRWEPSLEQIATDETIREVILSGGDPLTLDDSLLAELAAAIAAVPHVRRLRVHTRLPLMIPSRVTDELVEWLTRSRLMPIMVLHANHAQELDDEVAQAVGRLADAGITLLNQAVLLRGVNDSVAAQAKLSERLLELRTLPYYLHQLDRVAGASHFEVPIEEGRGLIAAMREQLPGYAVPRYVQEVAGEPHKGILA